MSWSDSTDPIKKRKVSGDLEGYDGDDEEDVIFLPKKTRERRSMWIWVLIVVIAISIIIPFVILFEWNRRCVRQIEVYQHESIQYRLELTNLKEFYEDSQQSTELKNEAEFLKQLYDISRNPSNVPKKAKRMNMPFNPSASYTLKEILKKYHQSRSLTRAERIFFADFLWMTQKKDVNEVPLPKDGWMGFFHLFTPTITCDSLYRAGSSGDGGKYLCNIHKLAMIPQLIMLSFGAESEITFEEELTNMIDSTEIYLFDPTVDRVDSENPRIHFSSTGLGPVTHDLKDLSYVGTFYSKVRLLGLDLSPLDEITKKLGVEKVDILKIDIEYGEVGVFDYIYEHRLLEKLEVKILLIEYHAPFSFSQELGMLVEFPGDKPPSVSSLNSMRRNHLFPFLNKLYLQGYYMYSSEQNSLFRRGIEYGFVHRSFI